MFDSITFNFTIGNFFCNSFFTNVDSGTRIFELYSNQTSESITCPHCGSRMHVYDNASVNLREIPFNSLYYTIFKVHVHRYRSNLLKLGTYRALCTPNACNFSVNSWLSIQFPLKAETYLFQDGCASTSRANLPPIE